METTTPKPFIFVLMPFDREFQDLYELGIKAACNKAGAYAERVDEQIFTESILDRIYNQISKADLIISDMTGRNPNVFYETGYAHALAKRVILLTKTADDIPFDLKHYSHIIYGGQIRDLIPELEKRVKWALQQPKYEALSHNVTFYIQGKQLVNKPNVKYNIGLSAVSALDPKIDVHNSIQKQIRKAKFQIGFLSHNKNIAILSQHQKNYEQPDGNILVLCTSTFELLPGSWTNICPVLSKTPEFFSHGDTFELTIRLFTEEGVFDSSFGLVIEKNEPVTDVCLKEDGV
jgi:hypothetical protein